MDSPAAIALVLGGLVACFVGYRLFRIVLAIVGLIVGGFVASAIVAGAETMTLVGAVLAGALIGAALLTFAYFFGVALVGAGLGAAAAHLAFTAGGRDPGVLAVVLLSVVGAVGAMYLQRYFLIVGTALGGAWAIIVGVLALGGDPAATTAAAGGHVWAVFPLDPAGHRDWMPAAWMALAAVGIAVQLAWTAGSRGRVGRRRNVRETITG
jgi:hypothetical protein